MYISKLRSFWWSSAIKSPDKNREKENPIDWPAPHMVSSNDCINIRWWWCDVRRFVHWVSSPKSSDIMVSGPFWTRMIRHLTPNDAASRQQQQLIASIIFGFGVWWRALTFSHFFFFLFRYFVLKRIRFKKYSHEMRKVFRFTSTPTMR